MMPQVVLSDDNSSRPSMSSIMKELLIVSSIKLKDAQEWILEEWILEVGIEAAKMI
jgi:hypothetical protein